MRKTAVPLSRTGREEVVAEPFRTGQPIEAPPLEMLAEWDVDLENEAGGIKGL